MLQIEKGNRAVLKFLPDNAFCRQAKSVAIKFERHFQVVYAQCDDGDSWCHTQETRREVRYGVAVPTLLIAGNAGSACRHESPSSALRKSWPVFVPR